jgi:hypothetical protein
MLMPQRKLAMRVVSGGQGGGRMDVRMGRESLCVHRDESPAHTGQNTNLVWIIVPVRSLWLTGWRTP